MCDSKKKGEKSFCCSIYLLFHLFFQLSFYLSSIYYSLSLSIYLSFYPLSVVLSFCQPFCLPFYYRFSANPVYSKVKKLNLKLFKIPSLVLTSISIVMYFSIYWREYNKSIIYVDLSFSLGICCSIYYYIILSIVLSIIILFYLLFYLPFYLLFYHSSYLSFSLLATTLFNFRPSLQGNIQSYSWQTLIL